MLGCKSQSTFEAPDPCQTCRLLQSRFLGRSSLPGCAAPLCTALHRLVRSAARIPILRQLCPARPVSTLRACCPYETVKADQSLLPVTPCTERSGEGMVRL